jgi:dolichyl-diphosphooligosaccharide--protein glycosyltransferase
LRRSLVAILPAHIMRSVAGGYDNESIAVTAITAVFYWWAGAYTRPHFGST